MSPRRNPKREKSPVVRPERRGTAVDPELPTGPACDGSPDDRPSLAGVDLQRQPLRSVRFDADARGAVLDPPSRKPALRSGRLEDTESGEVRDLVERFARRLRRRLVAQAPGRERPRQRPRVLEEPGAVPGRSLDPARRHRAVFGSEDPSHVQKREERPRRILDAVEPDRLRHAPQRKRLDERRERHRFVTPDVLELVQRRDVRNEGESDRREPPGRIARNRPENLEVRIERPRGKRGIDAAGFGSPLRDQQDERGGRKESAEAPSGKTGGNGEREERERHELQKQAALEKALLDVQPEKHGLRLKEEESDDGRGREGSCEQGREALAAADPFGPDRGEGRQRERREEHGPLIQRDVEEG